MAGPNDVTTLPASKDAGHTAPTVILSPSVKLPNEAVIAHKDYVEVVAPWAEEEHVKPVRESIALGDVEAWTDYVARFIPAGQVKRALLTWSEGGLRAVVDYHQDLEMPGRAQWVATHPFTLSPQWEDWTTLANGQRAWSQQETVNKLDMLAEDIVEPTAATVIDLIRKLRASVKLAVDSELGQDGSQTVAFRKDSKVETKVPIPSEIVIAIPVLKGHVRDADETAEATGADGKPTTVTVKKGTPVTYRLPVKVRPSVDDATSTLSFRFFMPTAERVLEAVYADRVERARALLGEAYPILRAAS